MTPGEYDALMGEVRAIRRGQRVLMAAVCGIIFWLAGLTFAGDLSIAAADRARFPVSEWPYLWYLGTGHLPPERQDETAQVLAFTICSCTRAVVIENQLPIRVAPTVWRVDTRVLGWQHTMPALIREHYPYSHAPGALSLVVRADWFIQAALDSAETGNTYFNLLFGKAPANLDEFLKLLGANRDKQQALGHIEAQSGVSVAGTRLITTVPTDRRADVWITSDSERIAGNTDPLEHLDRTQKFDASEIIGALPKSVAGTGELGSLQVYALANAQGQLQQKAPANIVVDHHSTRGVEIRNALSCVICHEEGLRPLKVNALREFLESGAEAYAAYKQQQDIERFHLSRIQKLIDRQNEDYATILWAINQLTPKQNAQAVKQVIVEYDAPLSLAAAARELGSDATELSLALGFYGKLPARVAQLAHGEPINRHSFEIHYRLLRAALEHWRTKQ